MAKRTVVYRYVRRRSRGRGRGGIPKLFDISAGMTNAAYMGYFVAAQKAADGDYVEAANTIVNRAVDVTNTIKLATGNAVIGLNRMIARKFGGRFVRKWIA